MVRVGLLELSLEIEEIDLRPAEGVRSADVIRKTLRVRELNLHDHEGVWIGWYVENLIGFADDATYGLRTFDFRVVRVDEFRLEERLVSIVYAEYDL